MSEVSSFPQYLPSAVYNASEHDTNNSFWIVLHITQMLELMYDMKPVQFFLSNLRFTNVLAIVTINEINI